MTPLPFVARNPLPGAAGGRRASSLSSGIAALLQAAAARDVADAGPDAGPRPPAPGTKTALGASRAYACRCGRPVFFPNTECLACAAPLGYACDVHQLIAMEAVASSDPASPAGLWRQAGAAPGSPVYRRCAHLQSAARCNWLVAAGDCHGGDPPLCRCCRLTRTLPDLSRAEGEQAWWRVESAKRRVVSSLLALELPVRNKLEDPERGLVFDLLHALPGGPAVTTGHADGVITLDLAEANDSKREQRRHELGEPYRTLLGHLRHETGHYYWQRLVEDSAQLAPWRTIFGDERQDYAQALQTYYANGAPADWGQWHVSAYASSHPWEDWAETWAHYLHMVDTLDTAQSFGLDGERLALQCERFDHGALEVAAADPPASAFLQLINSWVQLTGVLNELSRSMGVADFYPFVLSRSAVRKLHFVHRVIHPPSRA